MSEKGRITSIADFQLIQDLWQRQVNPEEDLNPVSRFDRMMDEVNEAVEERDRYTGTPISQEKLAGEVVDVIFVALGVLSTLNFSAEELLNQRMATNYQKYNPVVNRQLQENGMNAREAIAHQKRIYTRK